MPAMLGETLKLLNRGAQTGTAGGPDMSEKVRNRVERHWFPAPLLGSRRYPGHRVKRLVV